MGSNQSRLDQKINDLKITMKEQKEGIEIYRRESTRSVSSRRSVEFCSSSEFQSFYNGQSYFYGFEMVSKVGFRPAPLEDSKMWHKKRSNSEESG